MLIDHNLDQRFIIASVVASTLSHHKVSFDMDSKNRFCITAADGATASLTIEKDSVSVEHGCVAFDLQLDATFGVMLNETIATICGSTY